ncbi:putative aminopeptidase FrvX [Streptococcus rupicaprae]|uniref:Aminopeptidase FrvX n=2 Tax=Streptococcus rupicaprae TaxID=759619 RepID=A0ABV2FHG6_9STRE
MLEKFSILDLQPSQFYLSETKLQAVRAWFDPQDLTNFDPISIKQLDGEWIVVDGHSRLFVAYQEGLTHLPVVLEEEDWNWDFYRFCTEATKAKGISTIADLWTHILPQEAYETDWIGWCQTVHDQHFSKRSTMNTIDYITKLTTTPSPTGFTKEIMDYVVTETQNMGYAPIKTPKGGVLVTVKGQNDNQHRFITAHLDTLGAMVRAIKPDGRLKMDLVGGFVYNAIEGENCTIHVAKTGKTISGTMLMHQTSVHVYRDAGTAERNQANMEVRLDERVTSAEETRALGIEVGDFISFDPRTLVTENGFIKSRHLDDKVSAAIMLHLLKIYQEEGIELPYTTHFYFSNNEEIGYGGNSNIDAKVVEYLAVDMGAMGDDQQTDEYTVSICVKDGSGPYHYELRQHLVALCESKGIPYKLDIYPYYGSDASAAMRAGADVRHALLGAGIESSHSYERTHVDSVDATERLVDAYLRSGMIE